MKTGLINISQKHFNTPFLYDKPSSTQLLTMILPGRHQNWSWLF